MIDLRPTDLPGPGTERRGEEEVDMNDEMTEAATIDRMTAVAATVVTDVTTAAATIVVVLTAEMTVEVLTVEMTVVDMTAATIVVDMVAMTVVDLAGAVEMTAMIAVATTEAQIDEKSGTTGGRQDARRARSLSLP